MPNTATEEQFAQALIAATEAGKLRWEEYEENGARASWHRTRRIYSVFVTRPGIFSIVEKGAQITRGNSRDLWEAVDKILAHGTSRQRALESLQGLVKPQTASEVQADALAEKE